MYLQSMHTNSKEFERTFKLYRDFDLLHWPTLLNSASRALNFCLIILYMYLYIYVYMYIWSIDIIVSEQSNGNSMLDSSYMYIFILKDKHLFLIL